jgi:hypothetical protein
LVFRFITIIIGLMSQSSLSILLMGLSPSLVDSVKNRLFARGVNMEGLVVTNTPWSDAEIARIVSSKNWSGIIIGYGVQMNREMYERVVQIVQRVNPNIPLLHHAGSDDAENAIERHFNIRLPPAIS